MYSPFRRKVVVTKSKKDSNPETKFETIRHSEERDKFIEQFGKVKFDRECRPGGTFERYVDIPIPPQYEYVWSHFLYMWSQCDFDINGNRIFTFGTVKEYQDLFGFNFTMREKKLFFKIKNWALEIVNELNKD